MASSQRDDGRRLILRYLQVLLFWDPLVCAGITLYTGAEHFWGSFAVSLCISTVVASSCFGAVLAVRHAEVAWYRWRARPVPDHGTGWYFALSMLTMPAGLWLAFQVVGWVFDFEVQFRFAEYKFGLGLGAIISSGFLLWETRRDALFRVQALEKTELAAQLAALTAQMNPHLLFNALNTVASLIPTDPAKAEETIVRLSELYRGVLASTKRTTHGLGEELRICEAYLEIEQARFGERLRSRVELPEELRTRAQVPVLILQPLVENAVKHGLSPRAAGGTVTIRGRLVERDLELVVEDDGVGLGASAQRGAGVGVENTRRRLALSYGERASLVLSARPEGGTQAVLRLPFDEEVRR